MKNVKYTKEVLAWLVVVVLGCGAAPNTNAQALNETHKLLPTDGTGQEWFGFSVAVAGNYALVGTYLDDDNGRESGSVYVFDVTTGTQLRKLLPDDGAPGRWFGYSVAALGNYAVIGSPVGGFGTVYVFDITTGEQLRKLLPAEGANGDSFGWSVAVSGNYAVIGAIGDSENGFSSGSAYIFDITTGAQLHNLLPDDGSGSDEFSHSVAVSGNYAVIGAIGDSDNGGNSGSAYVFDITTGGQLHKLLPTDGASNDKFGSSAAVSGNYAVIGAPGDDYNGFFTGSAYVFDITTGQQLRNLRASDGESWDDFGSSVAMAGNYAIVGARGDGDNGDYSGSAYIFDVTTGGQLHKLLSTDGSVGDGFAESVAMAGNYAVIGANEDDDNGTASGSAYVFSLNFQQDGYAEWIAPFGLAGTDADKNADPDGDGASNLLEYALGLDPTDGSDYVDAMPVPEIHADGSLWLRFNIPSPTPAGLNYRVDVSPNLLAWTTVAELPAGGDWTGTVELTPQADGTVNVGVNGMMNSASDRRSFMRLCVELVP